VEMAPTAARSAEDSMRPGWGRHPPRPARLPRRGCRRTDIGVIDLDVALYEDGTIEVQDEDELEVH